MKVSIPLLCLLALPAASQSGDAPPKESPAIDAEALRAKINDMRMNLLLGGESVRQAESEAIGFYSEKMAVIEARLDDLHADLSEKRASYKFALSRLLDESSPEARAGSLQSAMEFKAEIQQIELEQTELEASRKNLAKLISSIERREEERKRLSVQLQSAGGFDEGFSWMTGGVGLGPDLPAEAAASPLDDPSFVEDLLQGDERLAKKILFEADPEGYWRRFPLQPPVGALREALVFPAPDLPGRR